MLVYFVSVKKCQSLIHRYYRAEPLTCLIFNIIYFVDFMMVNGSLTDLGTSLENNFGNWAKTFDSWWDVDSEISIKTDGF